MSNLEKSQTKDKLGGYFYSQVHTHYRVRGLILSTRAIVFASLAKPLELCIAMVTLFPGVDF